MGGRNLLLSDRLQVPLVKTSHVVVWFRFSLSFSFSLKLRRSCCRILCECVYLCVFVRLCPTTKKTRALPRTKRRAILRVTFCFSVFILLLLFQSRMVAVRLFVCVSNFENNFDRFTSCLLRCCWLLCFILFLVPCYVRKFWFSAFGGKPSLSAGKILSTE